MTLIVQDPSGELGMVALETAENVRDGVALDDDLAAPTGELAERWPKRNDRHGR
jgi:hypothetical protein